MYGISVFFNRVARCSERYYSSRRTKKLLEFLAEMPKPASVRIAQAQHQRKNIAKKSDKYAPSTVYLQVLGSGARGAPATLYLFTDQKRYLFNCGECTQRLAHEHKVKLSRLDDIFITSKSWKNIGGLPGLSLTLQDVGVPNITLHGPEGLDELYHATKRFVIMKDMNIKMASCTPSEDFEDNALTVKYVLLGQHDTLFPTTSDQLKPPAKKVKLDSQDKKFEEFVHDDTDYYRKPSKEDEAKRLTAADRLADTQNKTKLDATKKKTEKVLHELQRKKNCTVAYICTLKKRPGTLDLAKCVELGVKPGPMLGQLKNGQDVVLPDGTIIYSKDVKTPDDPGPVFIVLEVPELSYLKESEFTAHFDNQSNPPENIPCLVVHYTPPHVLNHPKYRAFMEMFGEKTRHLILNSQNACLGSEAVHRTQHKLHLLDADIFPQLKDASIPAVWNSHPSPPVDSPTRRGLEELKNKIALAQFQNIINMEGSKGDGQVPAKTEDGFKLELIAARTLTMFHLRPLRQVDRSAEPKLKIQEYIQETMDVDGFVGSLEQFRRYVDNMRYTNNQCQKEFPKVVFLGTGSCIPSKTRNTSAIVLQIDEHKSMLMDCGEGTFGQLVRFYGPKKVNAFLRTLKAIYISHLHADHHIGLIGVLQARREAFEQVEEAVEPVYLLAPGQIYTWLSIYDQHFEKIKQDFSLIPNQNLLAVATPQPSSVEMTPAVLANIGAQSIKTCLVSHCPNAFGVAIEVDGNHKITYSGDTLPCESLVAIGKDSTLLIHEATMEDELADEARIKMHSTTTQAIDVGRQMNAKFTVLTHFSQRYARLPRLNSNILNDNKAVGIAFDNMQLTMSDLELLPHMYAPLLLMFAEHCVEMEMKAAHRAKHKLKEERRSLASLPASRPIEEAKKPESARSLNKPRYRESNASRLRQEMKGMTVSGLVRPPRSKSASPMKRGSSTNSSPTRSTNSDALPLKTQDSKKIIELKTSRTLSETSYGSETPEAVFKAASLPCGYIVDTRSKTLNTVHPPNEAEEEDDKDTKDVKEKDKAIEKIDSKISKQSKENAVSTPPPHYSVRPTSSSGYGKPLLTPVNKKLMIRRDALANDPTLEHSYCGRSNNRYGFEKLILLIKNSTLEIVYSVASHLLIWRWARIVSLYYYKAWPCTLSIIAIVVLFWVATKERPSLKTCEKQKEDVHKAPSKVQRTSAQSSRTKVSLKPLSFHSPDNKQQTIEPKAASSKAINRPKPIKSAPPPSSAHGPVMKIVSPKSPPTRVPRKISSEQDMSTKTERTPWSRNSTEKLKHEFCRDTALHNSNRCPPTHSSMKSFKPQLEDIKSSYLLLNQANHNNTPQDTKKLSIINENQRKQLLLESRRKFQTKGFFQDSKYDKIEGLNWISWNN